jgi:hypothetical protein
MKNNKTIYILLVALGLAIGAYFYFKKKNEDALKLANDATPGQSPVKDTATNTGNNTGTNTPVVVTPMPKGSLPFKIGSRGKLVQLMQVVLNVTPDGIWGKATQAAFDKTTKIKAIARAGKIADLDQIFAPNAGEKRFPLEVGKQNSTPYVKCLQIIYDLKIDGVYGAATAKAAGQTVLEYKSYLWLVQEFLYS